MCYSFELSSLIMALKVTINSSLCILCRSNSGSSQNRYVMVEMGVLVAQGGGVAVLGRPRVVEAQAPRERSHSSKGCGVTLSSSWQPRSAGHSAGAKAGNFTVLSHRFPVVYLEYPNMKPRHIARLAALCSCPTAAATRSNKLLARRSHNRDPGTAQLFPTLWQGNAGKDPK